jgi:hypothetical protein
MNKPSTITTAQSEHERLTQCDSQEIPLRELLEELACDGSLMDGVAADRRVKAAESWMQKFLDAGVRPSLDVVRVYMAEYIDMWERINKKEWVEREQKAVKRIDYVRFICTAVLAAHSCGRANRINGKHYETARRLLAHFGIPGCHDLKTASIRSTWSRFGTRLRPDDDLLDIFIYAQRENLMI